MIVVTLFAQKKVAVFGLGLSGIASAQALMAGGAEVHVWDDSEKGREAAYAVGLTVTDLNTADWSAFAAFVLAPGVPLTHPEPHWTVKRAQAADVEIIGDTELFCRQHRASGTRAKIAAITGTNGKSTTTALTAHLLQAAGRRVAMGGNIGTAALALDPFADDLTYVLEYSSFQIDLTPTADATVACLLNVTPDHIDRHGTLEHYAEVKARLFARMEPDHTAIISVDDDLSAGIAARYASGSAILKQISVQVPVANGVYVENGKLIEMQDGKTLSTINVMGIGSLRGPHNWQNAATAFAMVRALGLSYEEIAVGFESFPGLAHRMEEVGHLQSVLFINDSKATNADAAGKALAAFENVYWIAGGIAKADGLKGLEPFFPNVRRAYLIGAAAEDFRQFLEGQADVTMSGTLDAAVNAATRDALREGKKNAVVLLSPACASYDQYPNFAVRGDAFKAKVAELDGIVLSKRRPAL
jgi:UDP-N-acetylmuramoylalanine--D-glutamate ligase